MMGLVAGLCATTAIILPGFAMAQTVTPTPAKGAATLTVTYELKGTGVDRPKSNEKNVTWTAENRYELKGAMTAQAPSGFAGLHKPDAAEQQREANRMAAAQSAATNMQPMMEQAQKIMETCGDDTACMQREAMKMARGIDPNSKPMQDAKAAIGAASVMPAVRYQTFVGGKQSGTFAVKEVAHEAYFDAACSLRTEERCAFDTTVEGSGKLTDPAGATEFPSAAMAEIDYQKGSMILTLPMPGFGTAKKIVTSKSADVKTGTSEVRRTVMRDGIMNQMQQTISCGDCKTASGTLEKNVADELLGRPAKLVVKWQFTRS
jgi:hypothetical protein